MLWRRRGVWGWLLCLEAVEKEKCLNAHSCAVPDGLRWGNEGIPGVFRDAWRLRNRPYHCKSSIPPEGGNGLA